MPASDLNLVHFPAVIKLHADDELMLVATSADFENNPDLGRMYFQPQDILIDKLGHVFKLCNAEQLTLTATSDVMQMDEIIKLIQLHLSNHGTCCVAKFSADTIEDALSCL